MSPTQADHLCLPQPGAPAGWRVGTAGCFDLSLTQGTTVLWPGSQDDCDDSRMWGSAFSKTPSQPEQVHIPVSGENNKQKKQEVGKMVTLQPQGWDTGILWLVRMGGGGVDELSTWGGNPQPPGKNVSQYSTPSCARTCLPRLPTPPYSSELHLISTPVTFPAGWGGGGGEEGSHPAFSRLHCHGCRSAICGRGGWMGGGMD